MNSRTTKFRLLTLPLLCTIITLIFSPMSFAQSEANDSAAERQKTILVFDASGSMWGQINREAKISIAKTVVKEILNDWDPNIDLGLTAYGHRRKADCEDIEALVAVAPVDKGKFLSAVEDITPKGKTPLTKAVVKAAEELKYTEDKATVILVSDGIETCDMDPCEAAKKLEEAGVDLTVHVVGFDVNKEEEVKQLKCIADNTGGKFLSAKDAGSLKSSLDQVIEQVAEVEPKPVDKPILEVVAVNAPGGEPVRKVSWKVFRFGEETAMARGGGSIREFRIDPGKYRIEVRSIDGAATAEKEIEFLGEESKQREEIVLAEEGVVVLRAVTVAGGEPLDNVTWKVEDIPQGEMAKAKTIKWGQGAVPEYTLLPGTYKAKVKSRQGKATAEAVIEVIAGEKKVHEVLLSEEGKIELIAVHSEGGEPVADVTWRLETFIAEDSMEKPKLVTYGQGPQPKYQVLPGKYVAKVKSRLGFANAEQVVEVVGGKLIRQEVVLPQEGDVVLKAVNSSGSDALSDVKWNIYQVMPEGSMDKPKQITYGKGATPTYRLLPGKYLAKVTSNRGTAKAEKIIEVIAGKKITEEVSFPSEGEIELRVVSEAGGAPLSGRYSWNLKTLVPADSMDKPVQLKYGGGANPTYRAEEGKYLATVRFPDGEKSEVEVEIIGGKKSTAEIMSTDEG